MNKPTVQAPTGGQDAELLPRIQQLLEPLAALAVGRVPYDVLTGLLKGALIQAAETELQREAPAKRVTKSAIALKTGIDSRSLAPAAPVDGGQDDLSHPFADLLALWQWDGDWQDPAAAAPLQLPIYGPGKTFQTLVNRAIGKNISYSEVLETLLNSGNIRRTEDNRLQLVDPFYKHGASELEAGRFDFFGKLSEGLAYCIRDRMATPDFDPNPNAVSMLVRSVPEDRLPELARDIGELLLKHADEAGDRLDEYDDESARGPTVTAGVGNFFWTRPNSKN